jgi:hypothetical protein
VNHSVPVSAPALALAPTMAKATVLLLALCAMAPLHAQQQAARIQADAGVRSSGRIAVNQASGSGNAQANLATLALAADGRSWAAINATQATTPDRNAVLDADASIAGNAFAGGTGVFAVNQAAGNGNLQVNAFALGASAITVHDAVLAQAAGDTSTERTDTVVQVRRASIDADAFRGGQGVVQVNQAAGIGNLSTNAIVLQLPGSAP